MRTGQIIGRCLLPGALILLAGLASCRETRDLDPYGEPVRYGERTWPGPAPRYTPPAQPSTSTSPSPSSISTYSSPPQSATTEARARLEVVHQFQGPMPTGVAVSHDGRIFVNYPRWEDPVEYTVVELVNDHEQAYPSKEFNGGADNNPDALFSVQSVVIDPRNRLWCVDTGSENMQPIKNLAMAKLVCIDLASNRVVQTIHFPPNVVFDTSYINDVRFDLTRGRAGYAFITDSSPQGPNGIIVVDLDSGHSWRKLNDHPTTKAENISLNIEGQAVMLRNAGELPRKVTVGSDGIAIMPPGRADQRLFYCPLAGRQLHSVSVDALVDEQMSDQDVARTIRSERREFASDGLECDAKGRLFLTDIEHNAIKLRSNEGSYQTLASDPQMLWPDSLAIGPDGYLYFTCNQLHRQKKFNNGADLRRPPYYLFRIQAGASPVTARRVPGASQQRGGSSSQ